MAPIKKEVNGWRLVTSESGSYGYEKRFGQYIFRLDIFDDLGTWRVMAGGGPDQEQYGGASGIAENFDEAREMAYAFMKKFEYPGFGGSYNLLLQAAEEAGWKNGR